MKKVLLGLFLLCSTTMWADNTFAIDDFTIKANEEKVIEVRMYNDEEFTGFQFDLQLPDGVSVKKKKSGKLYVEGTSRLSPENEDEEVVQHTLSSSQQESGLYRVMAYSPEGLNLAGESGEALVRITIVASDQISTGMVTPIITNMEMTKQDFTKVKPEETTYNCTLQVKARVTTLGYASFSWPKAIDFSESGLTAFIAKNCTGNSLKLVPVTKVPANTGLILKGTAGSEHEYQLQTTVEATDDVSENLLSSNTEGDYEVASDDIYVLSNLNDGQPGFYRAARGIQVRQYKSYLQYSASQSIELYFDEDETTGISIINNSQPTDDGMYYDLQGRRVSHPTKGVYILNGKKIIVK